MFLTELKRKIELPIESNMEDPEILRKFVYFAFCRRRRTVLAGTRRAAHARLLSHTRALTVHRESA